MSVSQVRHSTRNKSSDRQPERTLRLSSSYARGSTSAAHNTHSPARVGNLPGEKVNKPRGNSLPHVRQGNTLPQSQIPKPTVEKNDIGNPGKYHKSPKRQKLSSNDDNNKRANAGVSDNKECGDSHADTTTVGSEDSHDQIRQSIGNPEKALMLVLEELKEIKTQMVKLNRIENTTASLAEQIATTITRAGELESSVSKNTSKIQEIDERVDSLKTKVEQQDGQLQSLKLMKDEISSSTDKTIAQMNTLIDTQRDQVDSFNSGAKQLQKEWKDDVMAEMKKEFQKLENAKHCQSLKDQAYKNRNNLVVVGLPEDPEKSTLQVVQAFFKDSFKLQNLDIGTASRLGSQPEVGNEYARPVLVKFNKLVQRNRIWRNRGKGTSANGNPQQKTRIQADLPKELREGVQALYQVASAASKIQGFENAQVRNYQLEMNDRAYQITDLEDLPLQMRPSTLASPQSDTHMVFFSKRAKLSNHYPAKFTINGQNFGSMEHFLAVRRAELSEKEDMIQRAHKVQDPIQAKYILNMLHNDHQEEWDAGIGVLVMEGLRAKFTQNQELQNYLSNTGTLILGEASTNPRWGIGLDISDPEVLDPNKWLQSGNLLGKSLMDLRAEFLTGKKSLRK